MNQYPSEISEKKRFSIVRRAKSFAHAGRGVWVFLKSTHNAWIQILALVCVVVAGLYFHITQAEWFALILVSGLVLAAEAFNTAIEIDINLTSPEYHPYAKDSKDVAAGAVLMAACAAFIIGLMIFVPYIDGAVKKARGIIITREDAAEHGDKVDTAYFKNATYVIDGQPLTLKDGISEVEAAPGSASKIVTRYFGNEAVGDLNGDGLPDAAFLITQSGGGSGEFYYAVAALRKASSQDAAFQDGTPRDEAFGKESLKKYVMTNAFFVGDRIAPQSIVIPINSTDLRVNYTERKPGEPMSAAPSSGATLFLKVSPEGTLTQEESMK